jgi:glycine/D-amino acid oxidase-like deaminating enzyme
MARPDLLIVGGGIIGCAAAAFAAERGASVVLLERDSIGAGASGRNSGAVQHPFDPVLAELHRATREMYLELAAGDPWFEFPPEPAGLLLLTDDLDAARARIAELQAQDPALAPELLDEQSLRQMEPMIAGGWSAIRLNTGYPIPPDAATRAFAARARLAGAEVRLGPHVVGLRDGPRVLLADESTLEAGAVLVAAGPWTGDLLHDDAGPAAIRPTYGVTLQISLEPAPRSVLEEGAVHTVNRPVEEGETAGAKTFSMVSVRGTSTVGSTFLPSAPDPAAMAPQLLENAARFVPAVRGARILQQRVCARPQSPDGRPFVGPLPGRNGLFVAAGHGPWGMSTGPASAVLVVDAILERAAVPAALAVDRRG